MAIDDKKIQLLIDGTDYSDDIDGDIPFVPVIMRDKKYHSMLATFSEERLVFVRSAATYLRTQHRTKSGFASSTFVLKYLDYSNDQYNTVVSGTVDYKTYENDEINGRVSILFAPDNPAQKLLKRATIQTELHKLEDFDGGTITAFSDGPHNETYTLSLTKTEITGVSEIATSNCEIMLPWEVFLRLAQKIFGRQDCLRSSIFERTDAEVLQGAQDGRLAFVSLTNGGLIRQGTTGNYPIRISLDEAFDWINQIEPIGMGIEYINDVPFMVVEDIDYFYDKTSSTVYSITNPTSLEIKVNDDRIYGKILSGYRVFNNSEGAYTSLSLHTKRRWITGLDGISDREYNTRTDVAASSYLIEVVRNDTVSNNSANEMDEILFSVVVKRDGGGGYEVDNDQVSTTGVSDPTTQKNYLLTPGRCILNHNKVFNAALIRESNRLANPNYAPILFQGGEGNKTASTRIGAEAAEIAEDADLVAGVEPIFYEDDMEVQTDITEEDYLTLISGTNVNIWVPVTYNGTTRYGYIEEIKFSKRNEITAIFKLANENY